MKNLRFNKEQLRFTEGKKGLPFVIKRVLKYLFGSVVLAVIYYLIAALFFNTPEEEAIARQNEILKAEYLRSLEKLELLEEVIESLKERDREIYVSIFKSDPPDFIEQSHSGLYVGLDSSSTEELVTMTASKVKFSQYLTSVMADRLESIYGAMEEHQNIEALPSRLPLENFTISQTGAGMGAKIHPFYKTKYQHSGVDLLATPGAEVVATADGVVINVVKSDRGRGNQVTIEHLDGYETYYAHLGEILVRRGKRVKRGKVIARVGNSGLSFAPHLHYEVLLNGVAVDPINYFFGELSPREYREMLILALNSGQSLD